MLTLEERERRAYIIGDTSTAAVMSEAINLESEKVLDLDFRVRQLEDEVHGLENRLGECECDA